MSSPRLHSTVNKLRGAVVMVVEVGDARGGWDNSGGGDGGEW